MARRRAPSSLSRRAAAAAVAIALLWGCGTSDGDAAAPAPGAGAPDPTTATTATTATTSTTSTPPITRPDWLGTRVLAAEPGRPAASQPTPPELDPRILPTVDVLPPPADGAFAATVDPVPDDVLARSTWSPDCPVARNELRYVTVAFWGFDDRPHTGELIVHVDVAAAVPEVFRALFEARFPIEEMRVIDAPELDLPATGDGNVTSAFVCRAARGSTTWSEHAYGRAIDVNPFMNPYEKGGVVLPELATSYLDRSNLRPGMIVAGDVATEAFAAAGWQWGGEWSTSKDWMHFSPSGR